MNRYLKGTISATQLILGTALTAAAFGLVIIPQGFATAGVTGFSRMLTQLIPINLSCMVFIINMMLLVSGYIFVGKKFVAKTIASSFLFPLFLELFSRIPFGYLNDQVLLSVILGGALLGVGAGLVLRSGASTGGFDVLAVILNRKYKMPVSRVMNIIDAAIILMQAIGQPLPKTIEGIIVITLSAVIVGRIIALGKEDKCIMIFSELNEEINRALLNLSDVRIVSYNADAGTQLRYTNMIVSIAPGAKVSQLKRIVNIIDPGAVIVINNAHNALGRVYLDQEFSLV